MEKWRTVVGYYCERLSFCEFSVEVHKPINERRGSRFCPDEHSRLAMVLSRCHSRLQQRLRE
jgi:hypothetical protein